MTLTARQHLGPRVSGQRRRCRRPGALHADPCRHARVTRRLRPHAPRRPSPGASPPAGARSSTGGGGRGWSATCGWWWSTWSWSVGCRLVSWSGGCCLVSAPASLAVQPCCVGGEAGVVRGSWTLGGQRARRPGLRGAAAAVRCGAWCAHVRVHCCDACVGARRLRVCTALPTGCYCAQLLQAPTASRPYWRAARRSCCASPPPTTAGTGAQWSCPPTCCATGTATCQRWARGRAGACRRPSRRKLPAGPHWPAPATRAVAARHRDARHR